MRVKVICPACQFPQKYDPKHTTFKCAECNEPVPRVRIMAPINESRLRRLKELYVYYKIGPKLSGSCIEVVVPDFIPTDKESIKFHVAKEKKKQVLFRLNRNHGALCTVRWVEAEGHVVNGPEEVRKKA
jgi:hypothetical protein